MVAGLFKRECLILIPSLNTRVTISRSEFDDDFYVITEDGVQRKTEFETMSLEQIKDKYQVSNMEIFNN